MKSRSSPPEACGAGHLRVVQQTEHCLHGDALARARLADEAEGFALVNLDTEASDRFEHPMARHERDPQLFDVQQVHPANILRAHATWSHPSIKSIGQMDLVALRSYETAIFVRLAGPRKVTDVGSR